MIKEVRNYFQQSVLIVTDSWFGTIELLESEEDKTEGLLAVMAQYSDERWDFTGVSFAAVSVWKITIESITGKQSLTFLEG